jgi:hypothetical protein
MYLGDGHIVRHRREVYRLLVSLDASYPQVVEDCAIAMCAVLPTSRVRVQWFVGGHRLARVTSYSKSWPCLFPQHGPGMKHMRRIELAPWQEDAVRSHPKLFLRGLIHSDGSRSINTVTAKGKKYRYPRYLFCNASADIRQIFCDACDRLGIEWRRMNARNISIARRESIARLDEFVGPKTRPAPMPDDPISVD